MLGLIVRRLFVAFLLLIAVSFATFALIQMTPGSYFDKLRANPRISAELVQQIEGEYGLNDPFYEQYGRWLWNLAQGDMGQSFYHNQPVEDIIWDRMLNSILLMGAAIVVTWLLALPMGIICAVHQNDWVDRVLSVLAFIGMSVPNFFLCFLFLYVAFNIGGWPLEGMVSLNYSEMTWWQGLLDLAQHMVIPVVVIATGAMAGLQRITRGNMLEILRKQYVTTARARGLPENRVIYVHALRNALNPLITIFGYQFSTLVSGAALVEIITSWPGMGQLMLQAVRAQDQFLVVGGVLVSGIMLIGGNLLADIALGMVDPRIQYDRSEAR